MDRPAISPQAVPARIAVPLNTEVHSEHTAQIQPGHHGRGLLLVGLFKLGKSSIAVLSGVAAYHLAQVDPGELALRVISALPINPVGRLAMAILDEADTISSRGLRQLGALSFVLALLYLIEGGGLMMERVWAEYFTVVMTAAAMPFELHEMLKHYTDVRLGVFIINAAVLVYLMHLLREKRRKQTIAAVR